ncbi:MAG TPA: UDP-N-acetylmuramate--L-alanine ligase [Candidatus Limnocylindria bacterium]|nr:UDP-N-acetylmuramate--L-alanine ligase [Candidatus Limnocylindria bacterium]
MVAAGERIHVIGIAGAGAAGTALLAAHAGAQVDGCDAAGPSAYTDALTAIGVTVVAGHDPTHLEGVERVAVSAALRLQPDLPELAVARERGIPVVAWQTLLGELMGERGRLGVAVAGTHGKSTATALLGHLLVAAGHDPTVEVGAMIQPWGASARAGGGVEFLAEADEYDGNFLHLHPAAVLLTTIEMDHPDVFADADAVYDMFVRFLSGMSSHELVGGRLLVALAGDPGTEAVLARLEGWDGRLVEYGPGTDIAAANVTYDQDGTSFDLFGRRYRSRLAGAHNVLNAVGALVMGHELGIGPDALQEALEGFSGASRRLELIADTAGVLVFDDYAHHPTEVRAALEGARQRVGDRRLWAVIEPHTFARTRAMFDEYASAFKSADEVVVADVFAARDPDTTIVSAEELADAIEEVSTVPAIATGDVLETADYVGSKLRPGEAVVTLGIGSSHKIAARIAEILEEQAGESFK